MEAVPVPNTNIDGLIYRHSARPEWGFAVIAWEREGKRGYRFEDGKLRVFTAEYWSRLEEADAPADRAERLLTVIVSEGSRAAHRGSVTKSAISLDDQVEYFLEVCPGGFDGQIWTRDRRGSGTTRVLKRHRDAAVARAAETMSEARLKAWIDAGQFETAWVEVRECIASTDLIAPAHRKSLREASTSWAAELVVSLTDLLYGEAPLPVRFDAWAAALFAAVGKAGSWAVASAPLALVFPNEHLCIKPGVLSAQALWMAPRLVLSAEPNAKEYARLLAMGKALRERLAERGLMARDLLDVYDFVITTLKPKARATLEARAKARRKAPKAADGASASPVAVADEPLAA